MNGLVTQRWLNWSSMLVVDGQGVPPLESEEKEEEGECG